MRARSESGATAAELAPVAERADHPAAVHNVHWFVSVISTLLAVDLHDRAERLAERAIEAAQAGGSVRDFSLACMWRGRVAHLRGDLAEAEGYARAALDSAATVGAWWAKIPTGLLVDVLVDRGRLTDAQAAIDAAGFGEAVPPPRPLTQIVFARGRLRVATGAAGSGLTDLLDADRRLGAGRESQVGVPTRLRIAEAEFALGRSDAAREAARSCLTIARRFGNPSLIGAVLDVAGRIDGDADVLRDAVAHLENSPRRLAHATALVDLGALLRRRGERRAAREPLRAGHDLAVACGAGPLAEAARSELASSGIRVPRRDPHARDELTPSELRVARMAADGATNKEIAQSLFLTVKTIEMHLSSVYRKLGVRSRRDLPAAL